MLLGEMRMAQFLNAALVALAAEWRGQEGLYAGLGHLDAYQARAHRDDVGAIMLAGQACRQRFGNERRAAGRMAIGRDRNADAGAAQGDSEFRAAGGDLLGELVAIIGIIDRLDSSRAEVVHLMT